eukprot:scaffold249478_cov15-Prasinocladus_malaysianus.AAC.1
MAATIPPEAHLRRTPAAGPGRRPRPSTARRRRPCRPRPSSPPPARPRPPLPDNTAQHRTPRNTGAAVHPYHYCQGINGGTAVLANEKRNGDVSMDSKLAATENESLLKEWWQYTSPKQDTSGGDEICNAYPMACHLRGICMMIVDFDGIIHLWSAGPASQSSIRVESNRFDWSYKGVLLSWKVRLCRADPQWP